MYKNATQAFQEGLRNILESGHTISVRGYEVRELRSQTIGIQFPLERVYILPARRNNIFCTIAETIWVIAGRNDLTFLSHYLPRAAEFSDDGKIWRAGYGPRLRNWQGVDQVKEVARLLNEDPNSRRAVLILFDPAKDYIESRDIPCNNWLHFLIRDKKLHLNAVIRSNDIIWGFSGINTFEWSVLHEMMAFWTGVEVGDFTYFISSFHLYGRHYQRANEIVASHRQKTLYDFGFENASFKTVLSDFDEIMKYWFDIEERIRRGDKNTFAEVGTIPDDFLRNCLQMLSIYNQQLLNSDSRVIAELIAKLPSNDFKIAAIEFFSRLWNNRRIIQMTDRESEFFEYFWGASQDANARLQAACSLEQIFTLLGALHYKKTLVYKDSWKKRGEVLGVFANIARKFDRIESIAVEGAKPTSDESLADTVADLAVYATKYLTFLAEHYSLLFESFIQQYPPIQATAAYSDNLHGFDTVALVLIRRYNLVQGWKDKSTYEDCLEVIRESYTALENLLINEDWKSNNPRKATLAADLAIGAGQYLVVLSQRAPSVFQIFVDYVTSL